MRAAPGSFLPGRKNLVRIDARPIHVQCGLDRLPFGPWCQYVAVNPRRSGVKTAAREGNGVLFCSPRHILKRYPDRTALFALVVEQETTRLPDAVQLKGEGSFGITPKPEQPPLRPASNADTAKAFVDHRLHSFVGNLFILV